MKSDDSGVASNDAPWRVHSAGFVPPDSKQIPSLS